MFFLGPGLISTVLDLLGRFAAQKEPEEPRHLEVGVEETEPQKDGAA